MRVCALTIIALLLAAMPSGLAAKSINFVGTWEGISGAIYTKLLFHPDETFTYCYVQSCLQQACWKMDYQGNLSATFTYANDLGAWEFERIDDQSIRGKFTNLGGGTAFATYRPE